MSGLLQAFQYQCVILVMNKLSNLLRALLYSPWLDLPRLRNWHLDNHARLITLTEIALICNSHSFELIFAGFFSASPSVDPIGWLYVGSSANVSVPFSTLSGMLSDESDGFGWLYVGSSAMILSSEPDFCSVAGLEFVFAMSL